MINKPEGSPNLLQSLLSRFVDKTNPLGSTNVTTALGASLMSLALLLTQQPELVIQGSGIVVGTIGFIMTLYKGKK